MCVLVWPCIEIIFLPSVLSTLPLHTDPHGRYVHNLAVGWVVGLMGGWRGWKKCLLSVINHLGFATLIKAQHNSNWFSNGSRDNMRLCTRNCVLHTNISSPVRSVWTNSVHGLCKSEMNAQRTHRIETHTHQPTARKICASMLARSKANKIPSLCSLSVPMSASLCIICLLLSACSARNTHAVPTYARTYAREFPIIVWFK